MGNISEKQVGIVLGVMAVLCFSVLSVFEYRVFFGGHSGVWSISFVEPMNESLVFEVLNESSDTEFRYTIFEEKKPIGEGALMVPAESREQLDARTVIRPDAFPLKGKIRIHVKDAGGEEREVFKVVESL